LAGRHNKRRVPADRELSCFFFGPIVEEPRQGGQRQRARLCRSRWPRLRQGRRSIGGSDRESHDSDGSNHEDDYPAKGTTDLVEKVATAVDSVGKAVSATDPTVVAMKKADGAGPAVQGLVRSLARLRDVDASDGRSLKERRGRC
jgi:hypothetical protein